MHVKAALSTLGVILTFALGLLMPVVFGLETGVKITIIGILGFGVMFIIWIIYDFFKREYYND